MLLFLHSHKTTLNQLLEDLFGCIHYTRKLGALPCKHFEIFLHLRHRHTIILLMEIVNHLHMQLAKFLEIEVDLNKNDRNHQRTFYKVFISNQSVFSKV